MSPRRHSRHTAKRRVQLPQRAQLSRRRRARSDHFHLHHLRRRHPARADTRNQSTLGRDKRPPSGLLRTRLPRRPLCHPLCQLRLCCRCRCPHSAVDRATRLGPEDLVRMAPRRRPPQQLPAWTDDPARGRHRCIVRSCILLLLSALADAGNAQTGRSLPVPRFSRSRLSSPTSALAATRRRAARRYSLDDHDEALVQSAK